jgi:DtxR family Mn-dependent transcriptional regulator
VLDSLTLLSTTASVEGRPVVIRRISEQLQENADLLRVLADQGVRPGATMVARLVDGSVSLDGTPLPAGVAHHLFVTAADELPSEDEATALEVAPLR